MLKRKNGGRYKYSHLLAVSDSLESSSDGYFSLSESYVTADQTIHRTVGLHVQFYSPGSSLLIRCVLEHE